MTTTAMSTPATDRREAGSLQAFVLIVTASLTVMVAALIGPSLPLMQRHFHDVPNVAYWVPMTLTIPMLTMAFCSVWIGMLSDRVGRKRLLIVSTVLYSIFGTAPLYLPTLPSIIISRAVLGLMESALMVVATSMIGDYFHGARRDRLMAMQVMVPSIVGFALNIVGGMFAERGWREPYIVFAVALLLVPLMMMYLWEPAKADPKTHRGTQRQAEPQRLGLGLLARIGALGVVGGLAYLVVPVNFGYLINALGVTSSASIGIAFGLNSLGVIAGTVVFGWVLARRLSVPMQLGVAAAIVAAGFLMMPGAKTYESMVVAGVVNGLGCGIMLPALVTWIMRSVSAAQRGLGNGAFQSALYLGMSTSPLVVVGLKGLMGGTRVAAVGVIGTALAVLAGIAVLYALVTSPRYRPAVE